MNTPIIITALRSAQGALLELAHRASESGDESLNAMFNEEGMGREAAKLVRTALRSIDARERSDRAALEASAFEILEVIGHPAAAIHRSIQAGQYFVGAHHRRHADDPLAVTAEPDSTVHDIGPMLEALYPEQTWRDKRFTLQPATWGDLEPIELSQAAQPRAA